MKSLALAFALSNGEKVSIGMFTCAFDASGHEKDQRFLVVGGFVSSSKEWISFENSWNARLEADGLSYFRAEDFAHSTGPFASGWRRNEQRRRRLLTDLVSIIQRHTFRKFGCIVENGSFLDKLSFEEREDYHLRAYALAGRGCCGQVRKWAASERITYCPELFFEDGDLGKDELRRRLIDDGFPEPIFRPKKERPMPGGLREPGYVPFQAADFYAYELFLGVKRDSESRWAMQQFRKIPQDPEIYSIDDLENLKGLLGLSKAINEWSIKTGLLKSDKNGRLYREGKG